MTSFVLSFGIFLMMAGCNDNPQSKESNPGLSIQKNDTKVAKDEGAFNGKTQNEQKEIVLGDSVRKTEDTQPKNTQSDLNGTDKAMTAPISGTLQVYKGASCGCCDSWISYLRENGLTVESITDNEANMKNKMEVPEDLRSCHTAVIKGQFIEGHIPVEDIHAFLSHPAYREAKGIAVPGMPIGSPGMEMGGRVDPYTVYIVHRDGTRSVFAKHK